MLVTLRDNAAVRLLSSYCFGSGIVVAVFGEPTSDSYTSSTRLPWSQPARRAARRPR